MNLPWSHWRVSSLISEIFDRADKGGNMEVPATDVQTTLIPAGGAAIVEFKVDVPGDFVLVDHSILRIDRGAVGMLNVSRRTRVVYFPTPSDRQGERRRPLTR